MTSQTAQRIRAITYGQARVLAAFVGFIVLGLLAMIMYLRRVETVEVIAVLLFFVVFLALLRWDTPGGLIAGTTASAVYVGLRWSAIHAVGASKFSGLIASRVVGLLAFGVAGGWANSQLRASLTKLDLYDQIDDATGLFNARFFVNETSLEVARSARYRTIFAVSVVDVPAVWFDGLSRRQESRILRDLGRTLRDSVRTVDRAVHTADRDRHRFAVILPETERDGANVFTNRLAIELDAWFSHRSVSGAGQLARSVVTFPNDDESLTRLREEFAAADQIEHPARTDTTAAPTQP